jgi:hypothetical protein
MCSEQLTVSFTEPGTLGLEFVSLSPPYIIKTNKAQLHNVLPGDKLIFVLKNELKHNTDNLTWTQLVGMLRDRPVSVVFERLNQPTSSLTPTTSAAAPATYDVSLTLPGSLGLEFEHTNAPWVVAVAAGHSKTLGIKDGDLLTAVDGESSDHMSWDELRTRLSKRPQLVTFRRGTTIKNVLNFFRPLVDTVTGRSNDPPEAEPVIAKASDAVSGTHNATSGPVGSSTTPQVVDSTYQTTCEQSLIDSTAILQETITKLMQEVEYHRADTKRLQTVISETQEEVRTAVAPYEGVLFEKQKEISSLNAKIGELSSRLKLKDDAEQRVAGMETRITQLLNDKKGLVQGNDELNKVVDQLLKKLQVALDEKPNFLDKRVVVAAVKEYVNFDGDKTSATHRLADKLGLSDTERAEMQPKPSVSDAFISFLADNTD